MESSTRRVAPALPVAGYVGGKRQLAKRIILEIEKRPHEVYAEPFVGMGGVFLRRGVAPKVEVINDASRDVVCLFRILQRHHQAFMDMLKWQIASRSEFARLAEVDPGTLTDLERAARFLYIQRMGFGGKVVGRTFGLDSHGSARFDMTKLGSLLEAAHERLAGVWIECLPWDDFLCRWDRDGVLFYCDPPYMGTEHFYGRDLFSRDDHQRLAVALKDLKGQFLLTLNDVPEVRELYSWARIQKAKVDYSVGGRVHRAATELIISGG